MTAGVEPEGCEGDEYPTPVVLLPDAEEGEEGQEEDELAPEEIVIQHFKGDNSFEENGRCAQLEARAVAGGGNAERAPSDGTSQAVVPAEGALSAFTP